KSRPEIRQTHPHRGLPTANKSTTNKPLHPHPATHTKQATQPITPARIGTPAPTQPPPHGGSRTPNRARHEPARGHEHAGAKRRPKIEHNKRLWLLFSVRSSLVNCWGGLSGRTMNSSGFSRLPR